MKTVKLILAIVTIGILVASCNKEIPEPEVNQNNTSSNSSSTNNSNNGSNNSNPTGPSTIAYSTLEASDSIISIGATTQITATATGDGLSYNWSTNSGDIIGSGSQVSYGASGCCGGTNTVSCTVKDANNNQESKSITIIVQ